MRRALDDLSRRLLHRGLDRLSEDRDCCRVCHRTPLVGESVRRYANGSITCALCFDRRAGEPDRIELVHHSEWGHAVKPMPRAA
jgi:hypothetical protein